MNPIKRDKDVQIEILKKQNENENNYCNFNDKII